MSLDTASKEFDQAIAHLKKELSLISTGRADPSLLEDVVVNAYDAMMRLQELASITVPEPRILLIEPWDKSILKEIIGGLQNANLDGQIQASGDSIRYIIPQMTEENRMRFVKQVRERIEKARIAVRQVRDKAKELIQEQEKRKEFSEDEKFSLLKKLDVTTGSYNDQIKVIGEQKEKDILTI